MYQPTNLTNREAYRMGCLSEESIEAMIDRQESIEAAEGVTHYLSEAAGATPDEDFLSCIMKDLVFLRARLRGENRTIANGLIDSVDYWQTVLANQADYCREQINLAKKDLEDAGL